MTGWPGHQGGNVSPRAPRRDLVNDRRALAPGPLTLVLALALSAVPAACGVPPAPSAATGAPSLPVPAASAVSGSITEDGLRSTLEALSATAAGSDAYRALGSAGYDAAADLVGDRLRAAGWTVTDDSFTAEAFADLGGSTVEVGGRAFEGADVRPLIYAPAGEAEGPVVAIDWDPDATGPGETGCAAADYGTLPPNAIVLVRSGPCYRRLEVLAAQEAGAAGFVAVPVHAPPGAVLRATLIESEGLTIPAAAVSIDIARALAAAASTGGSARLVTRARTWPAETRSVIAELPGETGEVVMIGAHLDSVMDGPGMNDDGSGVAALLEIARALGGTHPRATIRLAFWAGEEVGLVGSARYVRALDAAERDAIVAYVNADMIGSPNGFVGVYDDPAAAEGSDVIRDLLLASLEDLGGTPIVLDAGGGSDHVPFQQARIPTGGVYAGAGEPLTPAQAATFDGTAGTPADACYHLTCDDVANVDLPLARLLTAGLADVVARLAGSPELIRR